MNKEKCKAMLLDTTFQVRHQVLANFRDLIKSSITQDPDYPACAKKVTEVAIDTLWTDIEDEIERDLEAAMLQQQVNADVEGPAGNWCTAGLLRFRALVLHHYFPHDKSIFGKLKDPVYLVILLLLLVPNGSLHFALSSMLLLMLLVPGPPDEFQLLNFIMLFKGFQFISSGLLKTFKAEVIQAYCYSRHKADLLGCVDANGPPGTTSLDLLLDYTGTVVLTHVAAASLHRSKPHAHPRYAARAGAEAGERQAGGRLRQLLRYDLVMFLLSIALLAALTAATCDGDSATALIHDPQFSAMIFWCNVLWSMSTFPFLPLNVSWLFMVFSRTIPTGYNENGACVAFEIPMEGPAEAPSDQGVLQRIADIRELGRERRGGGEGALGDFAHGVWHAAVHKAMDTEAATEAVQDLVPTPAQLMMVWDRY